MPTFSSESVTHRVLPLEQLSESMVCDWEALRQTAPAFRTPFFSPKFHAAVNQVLPGIEVAVATRGSELIAILPFRRVGRTRARPAGAGINDAHTLLAKPESNTSFSDFLRASGLRSFAFHAAPTNSVDIEKYEIGRTRAFLADLTVDPKGYEHYLRKRNRTIDKQGQKTRKLAREIGPLRFEFDCRDPQVLERLIELKRTQYQRTHTFDIFSVAWIRELMFQLHAERTGPVRGILNVLFAGQTPAAIHFGMVEGELLHYWFPVYDPDFSFGSPGTQLFLDVSREAVERGFTAIDMGYGEQAYKLKLTNVITEMSYGIVDESPFRRSLHATGLAVRKRFKQLELRNRLKPFARRCLPWLGQNNYSG